MSLGEMMAPSLWCHHLSEALYILSVHLPRGSGTFVRHRHRGFSARSSHRADDEEGEADEEDGEVDELEADVLLVEYEETVEE